MKTLKLRIYDSKVNQLEKLASSVNFVWNYVNELSYKYLQRTGKFLSAYDLNKYTKGSGELLGLHSQTIQAINEKHTKSRKQFKKAKLNWRTNNPKAKRKALGWIPFKSSALKLLCTYQTGKKALKSKLQLSLAKGEKLVLTVFDSYNLSLYDLNTCEIVQDSQGRWYACITIKDYPKTQCGTSSVGLDLGLKDSITTSKGDKLSIYDAGWYELKRQLDYKCKYAGCLYEEVTEKFTTQTCSCCGTITNNSPKGRTDLGIREWTCGACNTTHDRDVNAAKNILRIGRDTLVVGSHSL